MWHVYNLISEVRSGHLIVIYKSPSRPSPASTRTTLRSPLTIRQRGAPDHHRARDRNETTQLTLRLGRRSPRIGYPAGPDGLFDGFERFVSREGEPHTARHKGESRSRSPTSTRPQLRPPAFTRRSHLSPHISPALALLKPHCSAQPTCVSPSSD